MYLMSPTEVELYQKMYTRSIISSIPEMRGADVLFSTIHGLCSLQRKQVPHDFLKSVNDGRLAREIGLMKESPVRAILLEGRFQYWDDTTVLVPGAPKNVYRFTKKQIDGLIFSLNFIHSVPVIWSDNMDDTVVVIDHLKEYLDNERAHTSLFRRPGCPAEWGIPSAQEFGLWILQSFPGFGPSLAQNILDAFEGQIPLRWDCTLNDLRNIKGIGETRAKKLWEALPASKYKA